MSRSLGRLASWSLPPIDGYPSLPKAQSSLLGVVGARSEYKFVASHGAVQSRSFELFLTPNTPASTHPEALSLIASRNVFLRVWHALTAHGESRANRNGYYRVHNSFYAQVLVDRRLMYRLDTVTDFFNRMLQFSNFICNVASNGFPDLFLNLFCAGPVTQNA